MSSQELFTSLAPVLSGIVVQAFGIATQAHFSRQLERDLSAHVPPPEDSDELQIDSLKIRFAHGADMIQSSGVVVASAGPILNVLESFTGQQFAGVALAALSIGVFMATVFLAKARWNRMTKFGFSLLGGVVMAVYLIVAACVIFNHVFGK